jgi:twitching motility protein PilJ
MQLNPTHWLTNIKIGPRLAVGYVVVLTMMIASLAFTIYDLNRIEAETAQLDQEAIQRRELINDMSVSVHVVQRVIRSVMLLQAAESPEDAARERLKIDAARDEFTNIWNKLDKIITDEEGDALMKKALDDRDKAVPVNNRAMDLASQGKHDLGIKLLLKEGVPLLTAREETLKKLTKQQDELLDELKDELKQQYRSTLVLVSGIAAGALLISILFAVLIARSITRPLHSLQGAIHSVSAGGTMESLAMIDTRDEFNDMGFAVNQMLQSQISMREKAEEEQHIAEENRKKAEAENEALNNSVISILEAMDSLSRRDLTVRAPVTKDMIGTVSDSVNALADETSKVLQGVTQIAAQVAEVSNKVRAQGETVSLTAADERKSVNDMFNSLGDATSSINRVAALAEQSNLSAERATSVTNTALATVNDTVRGMDSIRETISETEKRIKRLGERSQEISGIVNLINTISERTHVLALNASMQAAVAGEAGRGFAVVAEEVQRLAESSRNATQQIATLVNNIQLETNETIATVNRTIGQVVQGSEQAQKAGEQMRQTQEITNELVEQVRRIAAASDQQKEVSVQLLESIQRLGSSNENTTQQIDAQFKETLVLQDSAKKLVESVSVFKLPQPA